MSNLDVIYRYSRLLEKTGGGRYPSKKYLSDELCVSERSIERYVQRLNSVFGIPISFDTARKGYYIEDEDIIEVDAMLRFFDIAETAELMMKAATNRQAVFSCLKFETHGAFSGAANVKPLLSAVLQCREVKFKHYSYHNNEETGQQVKPYFLKEYQGRWYLIGKPDWLNDFRAFGIDRMSEIQVMEEVFTRTDIDVAFAKYENVIGLYNDGKPVVVKFSTGPMQANYFRSLKLHHTQQEEETGDGKVIFSLLVKLNYELKQKLLMHHSNIKILEPPALVQEIMEMLSATLAQYEN